MALAEDSSKQPTVDVSRQHTRPEERRAAIIDGVQDAIRRGDGGRHVTQQLDELRPGRVRERTHAQETPHQTPFGVQQWKVEKHRRNAAPVKPPFNPGAPCQLVAEYSKPYPA